MFKVIRFLRYTVVIMFIPALMVYISKRGSPKFDVGDCITLKNTDPLETGIRKVLKVGSSKYLLEYCDNYDILNGVQIEYSIHTIDRKFAKINCK